MDKAIRQDWQTEDFTNTVHLTRQDRCWVSYPTTTQNTFFSCAHEKTIKQLWIDFKQLKITQSILTTMKWNQKSVTYKNLEKIQWILINVYLKMMMVKDELTRQVTKLSGEGKEKT